MGHSYTAAVPMDVMFPALSLSHVPLLNLMADPSVDTIGLGFHNHSNIVGRLRNNSINRAPPPPHQLMSPPLAQLSLSPVRAH